jgi:hypothetical protein
MLPKLNGISGCSVWQVFRGGRDASRWSSTDIRIVAVQAGVYKRSIKGARWGAVAYLPSTQYPELRPHLTLTASRRQTRRARRSRPLRNFDDYRTRLLHADWSVGDMRSRHLAHIGRERRKRHPGDRPDAGGGVAQGGRSQNAGDAEAPT